MKKPPVPRFAVFHRLAPQTVRATTAKWQRRDHIHILVLFPTPLAHLPLHLTLKAEALASRPGKMTKQQAGPLARKLQHVFEELAHLPCFWRGIF